MVGQEELIAKLKSYSIDKLPNNILLCGESGCGKHTLVKELSEYFNLPLVDLTDNISLEVLSDIQLNNILTMYLINLSELTEKEQNTILKFVEEPTKFSRLILITNSKVGILSTVLNRCICFDFIPYTKEELKQFTTDEDILSVCKTPGQIKCASINFQDITRLCNVLIEKLGEANYPSTLSIVKKFNYKDEYDKMDVGIFLSAYSNSLIKDYISNNNVMSYKLFNLVEEYRQRLQDSRINKEILMENLITNMWLTSRSK